MADSDESPSELNDSVEMVSRLLELARSSTGMDAAWLSRFDVDHHVFEYLAGDAASFGLVRGARSPNASSYCELVISGRMHNVVRDARTHPLTRDLPGTTVAGIGSYMGVPVRAVDADPGAAPLGMLCCASHRTADELGAAEVRFLELLANSISKLMSDEERLVGRRRTIRRRVEELIVDHGIRTVFQPVLEMASGRVLGVEALSRFPDDARRPDLWFADAHQVGLGVELELEAVRSALAQFDQLPENTYLAVNASPQLLATEELRCLLRTVRTDRIMVELTEHAAVTDYDELMDAIDQLRRIGGRLAVDDIGAGFASFAHVLQIRPDVLKIDISITRSIDSDPARRGLARGILEIAREIDAVVIAEGVETQAEFDCLMELGIDAAQGYFIARPGALPYSFDVPRPSPGLRVDVDVSQAEADVRRLAETRFELALLHSPIGVALVGLGGEFLHTNPALEQMLGYSGFELAQRTFQELTVLEDLEANMDMLQQCLSGEIGGYRIDKRYLRSDGTEIWGHLAVVLVRGPDGAPLYFISQIQDISERKRFEDRLEREARTDGLTGVANRVGALDALEHAAGLASQRGTGLGVCFCDLSGFKTINDELGHEAGDRVLQTVARRLVDSARPGDVVARWGGDEFIVILGDVESDDAVRAVASRLAAAVGGDPIGIGGTTRDVSLSVGSSWHAPTLLIDADDLIGRADQDMYRHRAEQVRRARAEGDALSDTHR